MLFYLFDFFGVTGIHEQYYIFYRVKPLYYFQNFNQSHFRYFFNICKINKRTMCCIVKIKTSIWENVTPYYM